MPRHAAIIAVCVLAASACGATTRTVSVVTIGPHPRTGTTVQAPPADEVLTVGTVGRLVGRCPRGARKWRLQFVVPAGGANDSIDYTVGGGPEHRSNVDPGHAASFDLTAGSVRTAQPGDPGTHHAPTTVATTPPLNLHITQASEPQSVRVDVHLALAAIGGETGQCALVDSRMVARTYFNGVP